MSQLLATDQTMDVKHWRMCFFSVQVLEQQYSPSRWSHRYSADEVIQQHIKAISDGNNTDSVGSEWWYDDDDDDGDDDLVLSTQIGRKIRKRMCFGKKREFCKSENSPVKWN